MSIAPFHPAPMQMSNESRRARLAVMAASVGIAAALVAYAASPEVRHAVSHAAHSVKHTVSNFFDHDRRKRSEHRKARRQEHAKTSHARTGMTSGHRETALAVSSSARAQGERGSPAVSGDAPT